MLIDAAPTFSAPAQLTVPGQETLVTITITWRHKDRDDLKEWAARRLQATPQGIVPLEVEATYIAEVIADWRGPVTPRGEPVPFSVTELARLMQTHPIAGQELYQQYLKAMTESRLKN